MNAVIQRVRASGVWRPSSAACLARSYASVQSVLCAASSTRTHSSSLSAFGSASGMAGAGSIRNGFGKPFSSGKWISVGARPSMVNVNEPSLFVVNRLVGGPVWEGLVSFPPKAAA